MDKKLKTIKKITPSGIELKLYGEETHWEKPVGNEDRKIECIKSFNFYNSQCSEKEAKVFVRAYINNLKPALKNSQMLSSVKDREFYGPVAWLCRMSTMGYNLSKEDIKYINEKISFLIASGEAEATLRKVVEKTSPTINIQKRTEEAISKVAGEIEGEIDKFIFSKFKSEFNTYEFLKNNNVKPMYAKRFSEIFTKTYVKELKEVIRKTDEQLNEGYKQFKPKDIKKLLEFIQKIVDDSKAWADNVKKSKGPRKKKVKSADQLIKRLKYIKNDTEFNLVSVDPTKLIGASEAWIFNVKTRRADHYVAAGPAGITVKGSTLQNFDEKWSVMKKIRKPLDLSKNIVMATSRGAVKYFDALKIKPKSSTGRLNAFSIILRVV